VPKFFSMTTIELANLTQIEALNQRGGRTLSIIDLIIAGTLSVDMAALVGSAVSLGASFLTAAGPGGAGKTSLLAALLGFLAPNRQIHTIYDHNALAAAEKTENHDCYLLHEISNAGLPSYLWGTEVNRFLGLAKKGQQVISCLHADHMEEVTSALFTPPLSVSPDNLAAIEFILFIIAERASTAYGLRHRITGVYQHAHGDNGYQPVFLWDHAADKYKSVNGYKPQAQEEKLAELLQSLADQELTDYTEVRQALLEKWIRKQRS
jgi:hypothetical protein